MQFLYHLDWYLKKSLKIGFIDPEKVLDKKIILPSIDLEITPSNDEETNVSQFKYYQHKFKLDEVFLHHISNATIAGPNSTPRGSEGQYFMTAFEKSYAVLEKSFLYERRKLDQSPSVTMEEAIILNRIYNNGSNENYFHWIIDSVIPTWHTLLNTTVSKDCIMILPPRVNSWQSDILKITGLNKYPHVNWDGQNTIVNRLYLHSSIRTKTKSFDLLNPVIIREFANNIKEKLSLARSDRKIFISRQNSYGRRVKNWEEIKRILIQFDFEILELESLVVEQQIKLFAEASVVIGAHGAGFTNLIFSTNVKVLEIFGEPPGHFSEYYKLCKTLGFDYHFMFTDWSSSNYPVTLKKNKYQEHDLVVDVNKFEVAVNEILST